MTATKLSALSLLAATLVISTAVSCAPRSHGAGANSGGGAPKKTLRPFRSESELKGYFRTLAEKQKRELARRRAEAGAKHGPAPDVWNKGGTSPSTGSAACAPDTGRISRPRAPTATQVTTGRHVP